jgi:hypothetical protein
MAELFYFIQGMVMERHFKNNREIISFVTESLPDNRSGEIRDHISRCSECSSKHASIMSLMGSSDNKKIFPSVSVEDWIIDSYKSIVVKERKRSLHPVLSSFYLLISQLRKPVWMAASVMIIVLSSLVFGYMIWEMSHVPIKFAYMEGNVYVNNANAAGVSRVKYKSQVRVGKDSMAVLSVNSMLTMRITGDSTLMIDKKNQTHGDKNTHILFRLDKGTVITKSNNKKPNVGYSYVTPTAEINTKESELIINADKDETVLVLKSGTARIMSRGSNEEIECSPDKKYIISNEIESTDIEEDET